MNLYLTFNSSNLEEKAKKLSIDLQLQIIDSKFLSSKDYEEDYFLVCSNERMYLQRGLKKTSKPIFSDFDNWMVNYDDRLLKKALKGLSNDFLGVDLTAGFGKDALEIAKLDSCFALIMIEKEKWVFSLLSDGIINIKDMKTKDLAKKIKLHNHDNLDYLKQCEAVDLIYIDPMFTGTLKSKAKKHMQALRDLSSSKNQLNLLQESLKKASQRVIVKRHKNMEFLEGIKPSKSIEGKVVRYDVYNIKQVDCL